VLSVGQQLRLAVVDAPLAARRMGKRSAAWLAVYFVSAAAILGIVAKIVISNKERVVDAVMRYVMPEDWRAAATFLFRKLFATQEQAVITNAALAMSLMVVTITLFPIKEKVSATLEEEGKLLEEPFDEHPLWFEALEEAKLFLAMLAAQGCIFWLGYTDEPWRKTLSLVLSYLVLFAGVSLDFLSPVLQRHRQRYSVMIKSFAVNPVLFLVFGALFSLPAIITARVLAAHTDWSNGTQLILSFAAQVVGIALAAIGGTVAGAPLLADAKRRTRSHLVTRIVAWAVFVGALAWNAHRFYIVGTSINHKTQILKCEYDVDWSSFSADVPSALELALAIKSDTITVGVHFDVAITNPTAIPVEIEDNRLEVKQQDQLVALTSLPRVSVAPGATEKVTVKLPLTIKPSQALRIRELLTTKDWSLTLWLHLDDDWDFPIYLLEK
jgi:hypothetical protein